MVQPLHPCREEVKRRCLFLRRQYTGTLHNDSGRNLGGCSPSRPLRTEALASRTGCLHLIMGIVKPQSSDRGRIGRRHQAPAPFTIRPGSCPYPGRHVWIPPVEAVIFAEALASTSGPGSGHGVLSPLYLRRIAAVDRFNLQPLYRGRDLNSYR